MADTRTDLAVTIPPDLSLRQRRLLHDLLTAMGENRVRRSSGGRVLRDLVQHQGSVRVAEAAVTQMKTLGWITEDADGHFPLTDLGEAARTALVAVTS
ncbi:hypothetical protein [Micromonospora chalcea]|uniref:hypothetical protein n=1 Tax=Micromonospora chalcea TaxID=1874 RepID=UPI003D75F4E5